MWESGHSNGVKEKNAFKFLNKYLVIIPVSAALVIALLTVIIACGGKEDKEYLFDEVADNYAFIFNRIFYNPEGYKFHSLDIYCLEDDDLPGIVHYFVHAKYRAYIEIDEEWAEIDEVYYGDNGMLESFYCLSWDTIEGFEEVNEQFNIAVKEGHKKTYSIQEIQDIIDRNKPSA